MSIQGKKTITEMLNNSIVIIMDISYPFKRDRRLSTSIYLPNRLHSIHNYLYFVEWTLDNNQVNGRRNGRSKS